MKDCFQLRELNAALTSDPRVDLPELTFADFRISGITLLRPIFVR